MTPTRWVARSFPVAPDRESGFMKERHEAVTGTPEPGTGPKSGGFESLARPV